METMVFLHGDVAASISGPVERIQLDASRAVTWIEQTYSGGRYDTLELSTPHSSTVEISSDLTVGVALGAALKLVRTTTPSTEERPASEDPSSQVHEERSTSATDEGPSFSREPQAAPSAAEELPAPVGDAVERLQELRITSLLESPARPVPPAPPSEAHSSALDADHTYIVNPDRMGPRASRVIWARAPSPTTPVLAPGQVRGLGCRRGHPNRSSDATCRTCGEPVDVDGDPVVGTRPSLGWLIVDDGAEVELDRPCVLGHLPPDDHLILGEQARAVTLDDEKHQISRRHLEIHLVGWEVRAVDCGSTNGTKLRRAGSRRSGPLKANDPQPLQAGDVLELGKRSVTFVEHLP